MLTAFRFIPRSLARPSFSCSWWPNRRSARTPDDIGRLQNGLLAMEWALLGFLDRIQEIEDSKKQTRYDFIDTYIREAKSVGHRGYKQQSPIR
ncbi:hypothetical protein [Sphingobacterium lactis]|uniref:hypothetical protein n=1 Tax=Sphingobacterium lactis TaxID=797291 RepID=UPI003DA51854